MRLGTTRFRDNGRCYAVAYSPDGKLLASAGAGGVILWDAQSGKRRAFLESRAQWAAALGEFTHHGNVYRIAFSSDGRYLAAGCEGATLVWELATGKASYLPGDRYKTATDPVGFAPDNRGVFTGDSEVQLRDWRTGQVLKRWVPDPPSAREKKEVSFGTKALSADGKIVVAYVRERQKTSLKMWDVGSGEARQIEGVHGSLALSPDHTLLAALDQNLTLFDVATGKVIRSWPVKKRKSGAEIRPFGPRYPGPQEVAFSPDGKSVAIPGVVWSVTTGKELCKLDDDDDVPVFGLCFSPDGKTLAATRGGWIDFWKLPTGQKVHDFPNHRGPVMNLAYSPDGRQLATAGMDIRLWDTRTGELIRSFGKDGHFVRDLAFFPNGQRLVTAYDDSVVIWNAGDGKKLREIHTTRPDFSIRCMAISPDGKNVFAGGDVNRSGAVGLYICEWDVVSGEERRHFGEGRANMESIALSPYDKMVVTASDDKIVRLWDRSAGKLMRELTVSHRPEGDPWTRNLLSLSPDGSLLAAVVKGDRGTIHIGDVALGRYRVKIIPYPDSIFLHPGSVGPTTHGRIYSLAFSPDGKTIASSGELGEIRLFEIFSGRERIRFETQTSKAVFSPDSKTVASETLEGGVLIWDVTGHRREGKVKPGRLSDNELERLWRELASRDAAVAHRAIWALVGGKEEAVPFLRRRVRAVPAVSDERLQKLVDELDSDSFQEREQASRELAEQGERAKAALLTAIAQGRSLEHRRRAENLLAVLRTFFLPESRLRVLRVIEVFEHAGGEEAREALEALAKGAAGMTETEQARAALQRLRRQNR
ncbi:MAG TPA: WD40 repeat domain-containing protein [Gemmataceae bacterium]